jgi:hypothetical protein
VNAADLLAIADVNALRAAASRAWEAGNNAGDGYDWQGPIREQLVLPADVGGQVHIYCDGNDVVIVGDSNGPWAVRVLA